MGSVSLPELKSPVSFTEEIVFRVTVTGSTRRDPVRSPCFKVVEKYHSLKKTDQCVSISERNVFWKDLNFTFVLRLR